MRVLVTGGVGFIGWALTAWLSEHGHDVTYTVHENDIERDFATKIEMDITDSVPTVEKIEALSPDVVLHTAALSDADLCENNPSLAREVNVEGTENVITGATAAESFVVFFSSSFVFDGGSDIHRESDPVSPINVYGQTKATAEDIVSAADIQSAVLRIDQPYALTELSHHYSMVSWILEKLKKDEEVEVFSDWYNNPILLTDVCLAVQALLSTRETGIYHAVGPDYINRFNWARIIADEFGYDSDWIRPTVSSNCNFEAERPNARLTNEKLCSLSQWSPRGVHAGATYLSEQW